MYYDTQNRAAKNGSEVLNCKALSPEVRYAGQCMMIQSLSNCQHLLTSSTKHRTVPIFCIAQVLQLQVTGMGRTTMVDACPIMTSARLSRVIEKQTGVPHGSFALYYGSRPMRSTLKESGVTSGSTIELKFRGRGGAPSSSDMPDPKHDTFVELITGPPQARPGDRVTFRVAVLPQNFFPTAITQVILSVGAPGGEPVLNCLYDDVPGDDPEVAIVECTFEVPVSESGVLEIGWGSDLQYTKKDAIDRFVKRGVLSTFPVALSGKHGSPVMNLYHLDQRVRADQAFSVQVTYLPQNYWPNAITQIWLYIKDRGSGNDGQYDIVPVYNGCPGDDPTPKTFGCVVNVKEHHYKGPIEVGWAWDMQYTFKDAVARFPAMGSKIELGVVDIVNDEELAQHMESRRAESSRRLGANVPSAKIKQIVTSKLRDKIEDDMIKRNLSAGSKEPAVMRTVARKLCYAEEDVQKQANYVFERAHAVGKDIDETYELVCEALDVKFFHISGYAPQDTYPGPPENGPAFVDPHCHTYPGPLDRLFALAGALTEGKKTHEEIKEMLKKSNKPKPLPKFQINSAQQEILDYAEKESKYMMDKMKNYVVKKGSEFVVRQSVVHGAKAFVAHRQTIMYGARPAVARGVARLGLSRYTVGSQQGRRAWNWQRRRQRGARRRRQRGAWQRGAFLRT